MKCCDNCKKFLTDRHKAMEYGYCRLKDRLAAEEAKVLKTNVCPEWEPRQ